MVFKVGEWMDGWMDGSSVCERKYNVDVMISAKQFQVLPMI